MQGSLVHKEKVQGHQKMRARRQGQRGELWTHEVSEARRGGFLKKEWAFYSVDAAGRSQRTPRTYRCKII